MITRATPDLGGLSRRPTTRPSEIADAPYFGSGSGRPKRSQRAVRILSIGPLRHDVVVPQQHAVERPGRGDQLGAILGEYHPLDQRIDRRILDADEIARARRGRPPASPSNRAARCPATAIAPQTSMMMSKSQLRSRFSYWASSTVRTVTVTPRRSSEGL